MLLIQNGRVLDPYTQMDALRDVLIGDDGVIAQVAEHIEHFCALGGEKCICMGGDLDGTGDMLIRGIEDCSKTWSVAEELLKRNYSEQTVEDIMWNNARNYLAKMLPEK